MPMIVVVVASSFVILVVVIGLADALTHLLCGVARSLKDPDAMRAGGPSTDAITRRLAS